MEKQTSPGRAPGEEERLLRALNQGTSDIVVILDAAGVIRYENSAVERILGYRAERRVGNSAFDHVHPDDLEKVKEEFSRALQRPGPNPPVRFRLRHADGSWRHIETIRNNLLEDSAVQGMVNVSRDITDRVEAEEALKAAEERYRTLVEQVPVAAYSHAPAPAGAPGAMTRMPLEYISPRVEDILGYPAKDFVQKAGLWAALVHPDDKERVLAEDVRTDQTGDPYEVEYRMRHAGGGWRWVRDASALVRDGEGRPLFWQGVLQDVTERARAEEELRQSEERFRRLVELSPDAIAVNSENEILFVNAAGAALVGASSPEELVGRSALDFVHPDYREFARSRRSQIEERGESADLAEQRWLRLDGDGVDVEVASTPVTYLGRPATQLIARDITERKKREARLRLLESVAVNANDAIIISEAWPVDDPGPKIVYVNETFTRMTGYEPEEVVGKTPRLLQGLGTELAQLGKIRASLERWEPVRAEVLNYRKDGTEFWVELSITPVADEAGRITHWVSVQRDTTERRRMEEVLRESEGRHRAIMEQSIESIYLFDPDTRRILESNEALQGLLGYGPEELSRMTLYDIVAHEPEDIDLTVERNLLEEQRFVGERRYRRKDGGLIEVEVSASVIPYHGGRAVCAVARDVTEQRALQEQLTHQAFHDPLTDMPNRALFLDRLDHALSRIRREDGSLAILFVDLDDFKAVNDSLGHEGGDSLLWQVGRRIRSSVRPGDTVGRLFGDEFGVLLDAPIELQEARQVTERIMEGLQQPFHLGGREVFVDSSIGIVCVPSTHGPEGDSPKDILRRADLAMYAAKSSGKGRYEIFNPSMNTRAVQRMELKNELRRAVEREEFEVHYQPLMDAQTGEVAGLEALARWRHPERGLVAAGEFIGLAEETGLVHPMGEWVFEQACAQARRWIESGLAPPFAMGVNFSAGQFAHQADNISRVLGETGLDPGSLIVEITERTVMDNAEFAMGKLRRLKELGVKFAIDDYGTGYSCLRYLKLMPVDFLKIDRMFVAGLGKDAGDTAIVHGTVDLAHALGLKVVAEGVETADQLERLKGMRCDMAQGYYLSPPLSASETSRFLEKNPPRPLP